MQQELRSKWIEALRSGKYKQGRGQLRNKDDKFCCLGVLCDIVDPTKWKPSPTASLYYFEGLNSAKPPSEVCYDLGVKSAYLDILVKLNDEQFLSFDEIADWIETNEV